MEPIRRVRIFSDMLAYLRILPEGMLDEVEARFGPDLKKNADIKDMPVSTLYLLQDVPGGCKARCAFCVQSTESGQRDRETKLVDNSLVRYPLKLLLQHFKDGVFERKKFVRICLQTVYHEQTIPNLLETIRALREVTDIAITACCIPVGRSILTEIRSAGVDMVVINYETATPELFSRIRGEERGGPYRWDETSAAIDDSVAIFGRGKVGTHMQLGFGETAQQALSHIQGVHDRGAFVSLFAFQPLEHTPLEHLPRITHQNFHAVQFGSFVIQRDIGRIDQMAFDPSGRIRSYGIPAERMQELVQSGTPFRNRGCPGCNRIYYETNPKERFYTYPRPPSRDEIATIARELSEYLSA